MKPLAGYIEVLLLCDLRALTMYESHYTLNIDATRNPFMRRTTIHFIIIALLCALAIHALADPLVIDTISEL